MPNIKVLHNVVNKKTVDKNLKSIEWIIHGQGIFVFKTEKESSFKIFNQEKTDGFEVSLTKEEWKMKRISNEDGYISQKEKKGLIQKSGAYYWLSLDSQNQLIQCGMGEPRIETRGYYYQFDKTDANKLFMESLISIEWNEEIQSYYLLKNPITTNVPLLVKDMNQLSMEDVASNKYLPTSFLPTVGEKLYRCIAGDKFNLDTKDFPDFSKAIEYSIRTPGLWCNTRLKEKATEFGKDPQPLETYLRITLGQNNGESPGIPYVMEIWPVGHYSPIHNHSGANAIIRVLYGDIHVKLYPFLCDEEDTIEPFGEKDFTTGDITWISSNLNQVHQLKNKETNQKTCITIQCYMYDEEDKKHYDYFDYLGDENSKRQYEPDSDMDFIEFKKKMKEEWSQRPKNVNPKTLFAFLEKHQNQKQPQNQHKNPKNNKKKNMKK